MNNNDKSNQWAFWAGANFGKYANGGNGQTPRGAPINAASNMAGEKPSIIDALFGGDPRTRPPTF